MLKYLNNKLVWPVICLLLSVSIAANPNTSPNLGNIETSLFEGRLSYTIPVYTIEDPDFNLAISLKYCSEGFKPFQSSGFYGQDWTLVAGGRITRSVQGMPDDQYYGIAQHDSIVGMLRSIQEGNIPEKSAVFNMESSVYSSCGIRYLPELWNPCVHNVDYLPDIFHFDFCGYKGSFVINNQGVPRIISGDFVNINLSQMQDFEVPPATTHSSPSGNSRIFIRSKDGYTFIFGGSKSNIEYSVLTKRGGSENNQLPHVITAWHLSKIIAPNGRTMSFNYTHTYDQVHSGMMSFCTDYNWSSQETSNTSNHIIYTLHKDCLLKTIVTSDSIPITITFHSHQRAEKMYAHSDFSYCSPLLQLDSIVASYGNRVLRKATLTYQPRRHNWMYGAPVNYNWHYLQNVTVSGVGTYSMNYLYDYSQSSTGSTFPYHYYPALYVTTDDAYKNMVDRFGFWKTSSKNGLLSEISLPTGGKIQLTYGFHQYGEERRFRAVGTDNTELYTLVTEDLPIGGARIEQIKTYTNNDTLVETQTFSYSKQGTNSSSGIFYNSYEIFYSSNPNEGCQITNPYNYGLLESHIGYSYVQCMTSIGNQTYKTAYTFDIGHNSYSSVNNYTIHRNFNIEGYSDSTELRSGSLTYCPQLMQTGKLLAIEQYQGNSIQKATFFRYNGISHTAIQLPALDGSEFGSHDTIVCLSAYSGHVARKLFLKPNLLEQKVTYVYDANGQPLVSSTTYIYDSKFRKKRIITKDSRGISYFTRYTYPDDIEAASYSALQMLVRRHQINMPIEEVSGYMKNNVEHITSGTVHLWQTGLYAYAHPQQSATYNGNVTMVPDSLRWHGYDSILTPWEPIMDFDLIYYPYLYQTKKLSPSLPITDYHPLTDSSCDSHYYLSCEYDYDSRNRLRSFKPYGKIATTYTWLGEEDLYPSAKTIGNQTYTYTHIPYVGISSVTDPRGITTYYSYDSGGRLIEVYQLVGNNKQILNFYQYHFKTE